jgi:hypothetical protein
MNEKFAGILLAVLAICAQRSVAQEKTKSEEPAAKTSAPAKAVTPLRVQIVLSEYDGDKKISSLPYTLLVNADERGPQAAVRLGLRVPIETGGGQGVNKQFQYMDVDTNLDGYAERTEDAKFVLRVGVEKSSLYAPTTGAKPTSVGVGDISSLQPVVQRFRTQINLLIRDGQTMQATAATDPLTGHVLKVEVTANVIK